MRSPLPSRHSSSLPLLSLFFTFILVFVLGTVLTASVGFTQGVSVNDGATTYTNEPLVCSWNITPDTTAINVTWRKDGAFHSSSYDNTTLNTTSTIPSSATLKNEEWRCTVTLFNATANATQSANLTVQNSAPTTPLLFNAVGTLMGTSANVVEDQTSTFDLNSSDLDNDTLLYYLKVAGFCTVTDGATGALSCTPTHTDVDLPNQSENVTQKSITFWVDDDDPLFAKSASLTVTFNITPVNDAPSLSIATQTTNVTDVFNQTFVAADEEHDYPLAVAVDNATDATIRDDVTATVEGNATVRIVYTTSPTEYMDVGNRTVVLNLTDSKNASTILNFTLDILSVNRQPFFTNISPLNFNSSENHTYVLSQGQKVFINLSANDPDTADRNETITFSDNTSMFTTNTSSSLATNGTDAQGFINFTPTNADVGNHTVLVTITDTQGASNTTTLNFTIVNVNDAPIIYNQSADANNTAGNVNLTPLVAYLDAPFRYQINYTDPDLLWGETLSWSDNASEFNVSATGLISFTPTGLARNETINITVTDDEGLADSRLISLEILNNTPPYFNASFPPLLCSEGQQCYLNLSYYAKDNDSAFGDYVQDFSAAFTNGSLGSFSLNASSGLISFTPLQTEVGNYTVNITITDSRGASASQLLNITVNNTPDSPVWDTYDFSGETIVESHEFYFQLLATDQDLLLLSGENLTFSSNLSWVSITYQQTIDDTVYALLSFTPNSSQVGNHTIQLNVTDATGLVNTTTVTFTVIADTNPPEIVFIQPYGNASDSQSLVRGWKNVTGVVPRVEEVSLFENTSSVLFEANATDDTTPLGSLLYTWYYDGAIVQATSSVKNITRSFGFFSSGNHTIAVTVNDSTLESRTWTWNLSVANVNRPPVLANNLTNNLTVDSTTTFNDYFIRTDTTNRFYDPDDDLNSNSILDGNETSRLSFNASSCSVATLEAVNTSLKVTPIAIGSCVVVFTATDPDDASATSNLVTVTVTQVPQGSPTALISSGGGGGSSSSSSTSVIPINHDVVKPKPLNILAPKLVTIYQNKTIKVPIEVSSNWTSSLKGIVLSADSNMTDVSLSFDSNYIDELPVNDSRRVWLTVKGYRLGEDFEVTVNANVSDPSFQDNALILFNSIEQSQEGKDIQLKVTFAKDLLSEHDECQELNELLDEANQHLQEGDLKDARELIDNAINGCRYLLSKTQEQNQQPGIIRTPFINISNATLTFLAYLTLAAFLIVAAAALLYYHHKTKEEYDF